MAYFKHSPQIFGTTEDWVGASVANLIGGSIFFWVDRYIFTGRGLELWQISSGKCANCGSKETLYRLVVSGKYDRTDAKPIFLCENCSKAKLERLQKKGVQATGVYKKLPRT